MWWWVVGMPVLWFRRLLCRAGLHDDMTDEFGGYSPVCYRCHERI